MLQSPKTKTNLALAALVSCLAGVSVARPTNNFNVQIPSNDSFPSVSINLPVGNVSNIIVFGDSLSDNGNVFAESNGTYPAPPYWEGRWSNGPTWVEYVANAVNASLYNYAFGGSEACNTFSENGTVRPNLATQIDMFRNNSNSSSLHGPNDLYVVWIGANDYFNAATSPGQLFSGFPPNVVDCISNGINTILSDFQPQRLLVLDLPPLGETPVAKNYSAAAQWFGNQISDWHNSELRQAVQNIQQNNPNTSFTLVNTPKIFNNATANAQTYNFVDTTDACYIANQTNVCSDPNSYLFWDQVHPTTHAHKVLASLITDFDPQNDALQTQQNATEGNNIGNWFTSVAATGGVASWISKEQSRTGANVTDFLRMTGNSTNGVKNFVAGGAAKAPNSIKNWIQQNGNNGTNTIKNFIAGQQTGAGNTTAGIQNWLQNQSNGASNTTNSIKNWVQNNVHTNSNNNSAGTNTISTGGVKNWFQGQQQSGKNNTNSVKNWIQNQQQRSGNSTNNAANNAKNWLNGQSQKNANVTNTVKNFLNGH